jgi:hypothetical protein
VFRLRKWYMDCVAADGTLVLAYWASMSWGLLRLAGAATLVRRHGAIAEDVSLQRSREPQVTADAIVWRCNTLGTEGSWHPLESPLSRTLHADPDGKIIWHCLAPRARGRVVLKGGAAVDGLGYVERIEMTQRPWQMPMHALRWGRFLSEHSAVVWIQWCGGRPLSMLLVHGLVMADAEIGNDTLRWRGGRLDLDSPAVLRDGPLGETILARLPLSATLAPRAVLATCEQKLLRTGKLIHDDGPEESGWAIDETVVFERDGG